MSSSVHPPAGFGNPLGVAGIDPALRVGPCAAGRNIVREEEGWQTPCSDTPVGVMVIEPFNEDGTHTGEEQMIVPLCARHRDLMAEILAESEGGEPS